MIDDEHNMTFSLHYLDTQQLRADRQVFRTYFLKSEQYSSQWQFPDNIQTLMRQLLPSGTYNKCSLKRTLFFICRPITDSSYPF